QEQDIGVGERVALVMTRDVTLLVAMLGVMATGASYIPLSPDNQTARLADIFNDADVTQVLVSTCLLEILPVSGVDVLMLDEDEWGLSGYDSHPVGVTHTLADSAYVIYTSGSTGKPKGVEVSHRGLIDYCGYGLKAYYQEQLTGSYVLTSHAFDIGVPSLYLPLLVGGCVNLAPWGEELEGLVERLRGSSEASLYRLTPMHCEALLELLDGDKVSGAHVLVIGGETLTEGLAARLQDTFSESQLYNHYGPTETVVGCSLYDASAHLRAGDSTREEIPIGYAMANTGLYVVDAGGELQAKGGVGELYVGGPCVAKGYVGDPDRTAASFVYVPWLADTRLYRTGDRVRRLESGALVFLGRKDEQVKLRGYRIELGEIRSVLAQQAVVKQAAVLVQGEGADATLVGYVVAEGEVIDEGIFIAELERALSARLASYMCPSRWCLLDALPLTANGKLDRGALPSEIGEIGQEYEAAENSVERALVEIWAEVLRQPLEELSVTGDFFRLGGNSLLAVKLSALIKRHFDIEVTLGDLFSHPTIRQFGMWLQSHQEIQAKHTYEKIKAQDNLDSAPLTFAQQRLWFIDALQGGTYAYNITRALTLSGEVDISALQRVFVALIERHAIFRTTYQAHANEQALQIIHAAHTVNFNIEQVDLTHLESEEQETEITQRLEEQQKYTFNLADDVMLKVSLLLCQVDKSILIINMPHIATDGWSMDILTRECWALYEAFTQGQQNPLTALPLQYADYALWQSKQLTPDTLDTHWQYWQQQLAAMPQVHSLPLDFKRPADKNYVGEQVSSRLSSEVASKLCRLAKHYALTPFMLSHALCALVLSRHSGSHDIVMGMPIANRLQGELNGVVGLFVNTLVLRVNTNYNDLSDYFKHVKKVHLEAQQHQDMPFEKLVDKLASERSASHTPLFQILLATQNDFSSKPVPQNQALIVERREQKVKVAKFDLDINICINKDEVTINWTYDTAIFSHQHITTLDRHLCNLLSTLAAHHEDQDIAIKQLNILDAQEFTRLLTRAAGNTNYPAANCGLHELFERQVERQPEALAITSAGRSLSYAQLNARANAMAWYLIEQYQLTPEQTVAICLPRSELLLVSVLAVLKAGGAYLTIDPSYPDGRVSYILNDSEASLLLTSSELEKRLVELRGTFSCVMADISLTNYSQDNPPSPILNSDVASAYIVYTSGTSGKPKGVKIAHKGAVNFAAYLGRQFQVDNSSKVLQLASTSFDAFTLEWMWGLTNGGSLCICSEADKYHPQQMADYLVDQGITHALITPAYLQHLPCHQNYHFRALLVGGEACSTALAQQWSKHYPMYNAYGPSEATICATVAKLHPDTSVTIGTAIDNVTTYILDDQQQLLPEGAVGELYIGGVGVAQGYIKRPELDAERFVSNPFVTNEHEKLYRTGDLVRQSDTGQLVYLGRIDEQVKIRGYRIELAEIEQLLNESFGVKQAAVLCWGEGSQKYLIAYVMLSGEMSEDSATRILSEALAEQLPEYMVPSQFVVLEQFPLTVNGKVDKRALPQPELTTAHYRGPQNKTEAQLQQLWSSLLKIPQASLSCEANFFALGGDSILSIQLVSRAAEQGLYFSVKDLFRHQHIVALARCVKQSKGYTVAQEAVIGEMPLLPIQQAFFKNETALAHFNQSVLLSTPEDFDTQCLIPMLQALVTRHDALRLSFDK
ncbi:non-ribosomal peptide synthetase, partial [Pseudoalteromonas sp. JC3]